MASYKWSAGAVKWLINKIKTTFLPKSDFLEAKMGWGGANIAGDISPVDAAMSSLHSANRAELCNPAGVTIEYSTDAGVTWVDYGASDTQKISLFSAQYMSGFFLGKVHDGNNTNKDVQLRVTMNATKMGVYTNLKKILINFTNEGAKCTVSFEKSKKGSEDTWVDAGTYPISGWPGWNSYSVIVGAFGGGDNHTYNTAKIRMTFAITSLNSNYPCRANVNNIHIFGTTEWVVPSNIARTGHLYTWDYNGNATFPGSIEATRINGHTIQSDVPANAKFTDTTYTAATASSDGLMAKADKAKLDGFGAATEYAKKAEVAVKPIVYQNISVPASAWGSGASAAGSVRTKYADVALSGVTANQFVQVVFNPGDIDSYNLASICTVGSGKITIYAESVPGGTMTIPTIVAWSV